MDATTNLSWLPWNNKGFVVAQKIGNLYVSNFRIYVVDSTFWGTLSWFHSWRSGIFKLEKFGKNLRDGVKKYAIGCGMFYAQTLCLYV